MPKVIKRYRFKCPECGNDQLEFTQSNVRVVAKVIGVDKSAIELSKLSIKDANDDGAVVAYSCASCAEGVANSEDELRLKLETDFFLVNPSFVDKLVSIGDEDITSDKKREEIVAFFLEKDIEVEAE